MDDKNIREAENWFKRAVHLKQDFRSALFNLALLLADDQRPLEAAPFLNQLVKYHPDHIKGLILLGDIYINNIKDLDAAENVRSNWILSPIFISTRPFDPKNPNYPSHIPRIIIIHFPAARFSGFQDDWFPRSAEYFAASFLCPIPLSVIYLCCIGNIVRDLCLAGRKRGEINPPCPKWQGAKFFFFETEDWT